MADHGSVPEWSAVWAAVKAFDDVSRVSSKPTALEHQVEEFLQTVPLPVLFLAAASTSAPRESDTLARTVDRVLGTACGRQLLTAPTMADFLQAGVAHENRKIREMTLRQLLKTVPADSRTHEEASHPHNHAPRVEEGLDGGETEEEEEEEEEASKSNQVLSHLQSAAMVRLIVERIADDDLSVAVLAGKLVVSLARCQLEVTAAGAAAAVTTPAPTLVLLQERARECMADSASNTDIAARLRYLEAIVQVASRSNAAFEQAARSGCLDVLAEALQSAVPGGAGSGDFDVLTALNLVQLTTSLLDAAGAPAVAFVLEKGLLQGSVETVVAFSSRTGAEAAATDTAIATSTTLLLLLLPAQLLLLARFLRTWLRHGGASGAQIHRVVVAPLLGRTMEGILDAQTAGEEVRLAAMALTAAMAASSPATLQSILSCEGLARLWLAPANSSNPKLRGALFVALARVFEVTSAVEDATEHQRRVWTTGVGESPAPSDTPLEPGPAFKGESCPGGSGSGEGEGSVVDAASVVEHAKESSAVLRDLWLSLGAFSSQGSTMDLLMRSLRSPEPELRVSVFALMRALAAQVGSWGLRELCEHPGFVEFLCQHASESGGGGGAGGGGSAAATAMVEPSKACKEWKFAVVDAILANKYHEGVISQHARDSLREVLREGPYSVGRPVKRVADLEAV